MRLDGVCQGLQLRSGRGLIAGIAVTASGQVAPLGTFSLADFSIGRVIDVASSQSIIAIDLQGQFVSTFGGLAAQAAVQRGVAGVVIDGGCRDVEEIRAAGLWVSSRHVTPISGKGRLRINHVNVAVAIGGITVNAGDYIIGDETGLIRVPRDRIRAALEIAEDLAAQDAKFSTALSRGETFSNTAEVLQHR
jgi:regulator of RNase E activity RraA